MNARPRNTAAQRKASVVALTQSRSESIAPGRIAFLGSATSDDGALKVLAMCWPVRPDAWSALTQAHRILCEGRPPPLELLGRSPPLSWVRTCAPQLAAPFHGTAAEESSIATLLARAPIQIAIAVQDVPAGRAPQAEGLASRALVSCLTVYDGITASKHADSVRLIVGESSSLEQDISCKAGLKQCRASLPDAAWLHEVQMRHWQGGNEPVPLALARLIATAVLNERMRPAQDRPIVKAVLTKLANPPLPSVLATRPRR